MSVYFAVGDSKQVYIRVPGIQWATAVSFFLPASALWFSMVGVVASSILGFCAGRAGFGFHVEGIGCWTACTVAEEGQARADWVD